MKAKTWLISWLIIVISVLSISSALVYIVDPFFHYHMPDTDNYYYEINNQRSQNDGIIRHFVYDAMITGTSMTENFRTTETDRLFGCNSIKVPFEGGSYKEINDNIAKALKVNDELKIIIRCMDMMRFFDSYDLMRLDLGKFPTYLYDDNPFNDVEYLLNRDVVLDRTCPMILSRYRGESKPGITDFDEYSNWQVSYTFGINYVLRGGITFTDTEQTHLSDEEKETIRKNIDLNVTSIADEYPDVDFYYYYSPYSVVKWNSWKNEGLLYKYLEAEAYITELIVPHKNIHLFSFNNRTDITTDLNNYKDDTHYAIWINSLILKWLSGEQYRITEENYKDYLKQEYEFYTTFDYTSIKDQDDYEADYYAAALLNQELTGVEPLNVADEREFTVNLDEGYNYLCFDGQKVAEQGKLAAYVYDEEGELVEKLEKDSSDLDDEVHQYVIDLSAVNGMVTIVLNKEDSALTENYEPDYEFSNICMY